MKIYIYNVRYSDSHKIRDENFNITGPSSF